MNSKLALWQKQRIVNLRLPGLGPKSKERLLAAGVRQVGDLLKFLPRDYLDYTRIMPISQAPLDQFIHIRGTILSTKTAITAHKKVPLLEALIDDGDGTLRVIWYNQSFLGNKIVKGETVSLFGKVKFDRLGRFMSAPKFELGDEEGSRGITPIYRQIQGIKSETLAGWILDLLDSLPDEDPLPESLRSQRGFPGFGEALRELHAPADWSVVEAINNRTSSAVRRLIFEEFYAFQLNLQRLVAFSQNRDHAVFAVNWQWIEEFLAGLPFSLTSDQMGVLVDLFADLQERRRIYCLIQGDVGCGKTVVGLAAAYLFYKAGYQSALLCPTALLARQHYAVAAQLLEPLGMRAGLFTAKDSSAEARENLRALAQGEIGLAIGTHKLIQEEVSFHNLGLSMVDEQHRFGVKQRQALLKKGAGSHYLAFSATPIPRSLAMTLYGSFQILQIKEKPANRPPLRTIVKRSENRAEVIRFALNRLARGESLFWVFPLIEGSETQQEKSAQAMFETFRSEVFGHVSIGLVHGRMKRDQVEAEMDKFRNGQHQILVATTVIEVGVDVPAASIMVVEGANQFGLSQLHQLRGRVGRGDKPAFCFLIVQGQLNRAALERLRVLENCDDGFVIAEADLKQRGAGHLLGRKQSGVPDFSFGDPWLDRELMEDARQVACRTNADEISNSNEYCAGPDAAIGEPGIES